MTELIEYYYSQNNEMRVKINKQYDEWVSDLPCCVTKSNQVGRPHHLRYAGCCGVGMKPPDIFEIPIAYVKHVEIHKKGTKTFEEIYDIKFERILAGLHAIFMVKFAVDNP